MSSMGINNDQQHGGEQKKKKDDGDGNGDWDCCWEDVRVEEKVSFSCLLKDLFFSLVFFLVLFIREE